MIKQDNESALIRLQTFVLARAAGAKVKKLSDLWALRDEEQKERDRVTLGDTKEEQVEMWNKIMQAHGLEKNVIKN